MGERILKQIKRKAAYRIGFIRHGSWRDHTALTMRIRHLSIGLIWPGKMIKAFRGPSIYRLRQFIWRAQGLNFVENKEDWRESYYKIERYYFLTHPDRFLAKIEAMRIGRASNG